MRYRGNIERYNWSYNVNADGGGGNADVEGRLHASVDGDGGKAGQGSPQAPGKATPGRTVPQKLQRKRAHPQLRRVAAPPQELHREAHGAGEASQVRHGVGVHLRGQAAEEAVKYCRKPRVTTVGPGGDVPALALAVRVGAVGENDLKLAGLSPAQPRLQAPELTARALEGHGHEQEVREELRHHLDLPHGPLLARHQEEVVPVASGQDLLECTRPGIRVLLLLLLLLLLLIYYYYYYYY